MLICKFASRRSSPAKIKSWLAYLEELHTKARNDSASRQLIESLLAEARTWSRRPTEV